MAAHDDAVKELTEQIKRSIEALKQSMTKIRTGRANAAMSATFWRLPFE